MKKITYIAILFLSTATSVWAGGKSPKDTCVELAKCYVSAVYRAIDVLMLCRVREIDADFKRSLPSLIESAQTIPYPCRPESWNPRMARDDLELCNKLVQIQKNIRNTCYSLQTGKDFEGK
jgi:hypothetical protein